MKNEKKVISVIMSLALVLSMLQLITISPMAKSYVTDGDFVYEIRDDGTAVLDRYNGSLKKITVASAINNYPVTEIGSHAFAYSDAANIETISIPFSVMEINSAFAFCPYLTNITVSGSSLYLKSVNGVLFNSDMSEIIAYPAAKIGSTYTFPNTVIRIAKYAFMNCTQLSKIVLSSNVTSIGFGAFFGCSALSDINITSNINYIGDYAFKSCLISSFTIPYGISEIGHSTFEDCKMLSNIVIPNTVTKIGNDAFSGCSSLNSISIPNTVTSIGSNAFYRSGLYSVDIPSSVKSIGTYAFNNCYNLSSITIPDTVEQIGAYLVYETAYYYNRDNWENNVLYIGNHLIKANQTLSGTYTIKEGTKGIAAAAFDYCENLDSVIFPNSLQHLSEEIFYSCTNLDNIVLPSSLTYIGSGMFWDCYNLKNITIPETITEIRDNAFASCTSLNDFVLPDNITSIGRGAFGNTAYYNNAENWEDNVLYYGKYLLRADSSIAGTYNVKNGVELIASEAFISCYSLENIIIPDGVKYIGKTVTYGDTMKSATIPNSVVNIDDMAFGYFYRTGDNVPNSEFVINGYADSEAEKYANDNGLIFNDITPPPVGPTTEPTTQPVVEPTTTPSVEPTTQPIDEPTTASSVEPTTQPSDEPTTQPSEEPNEGFADVNNDGKISVVDAKWILQAVAGTRTLTDEQKANADVNKDGKVSVVDAKWILQSVAGTRVL